VFGCNPMLPATVLLDDGLTSFDVKSFTIL
jgi:hypothetical protein